LESADGEGTEGEDGDEDHHHCGGFDDGLVSVDVGEALGTDVGHGATEAGEPQPGREEGNEGGEGEECVWVDFR